MNEVILMTVKHSLDDLLEKRLTSNLVESSSLDYVIEEFSSLEEFHDDGYLHVFEGETVVDLHDVLVTQGLEDFSFDENGVNVTDRPDILRLDGLDRKLLLGQLMDRQIHLPEASFTQDLFEFILSETAAWVEVFSPGGVEDGLVFYIGEVVVEVLSTVGVEKAEVIMRDVFLDIIEG